MGAEEIPEFYAGDEMIVVDSVPEAPEWIFVDYGGYEGYVQVSLVELAEQGARPLASFVHAHDAVTDYSYADGAVNEEEGSWGRWKFRVLCCAL